MIAGEKNQRGLDACSIHGKYVEHSPEIQHIIRDENGIEPVHHAKHCRENDGIH